MRAGATLLAVHSRLHTAKAGHASDDRLHCLPRMLANRGRERFDQFAPSFIVTPEYLQIISGTVHGYNRMLKQQN